MLFTLEELKEVFPNQTGNINQTIEINEISSDSRSVMDQALFIPIVGENHDGHVYIEKAMEQGAVATLWEKTKAIPGNVATDMAFIIVDDTTVALQQLANYYRKKVNPIVIGITGSNGKTTTKDIMHAVLQTKYQTHATKGNFNNHLGMPFTILQMKRNTEVLILEMGMSDFKEIELLSQIAQPDYAIITNIGESHIEHLGSVAGIAQAKLEILTGLQAEGKLIIDGDETTLRKIKSQENVIACGFQSDNDVLISEVHLQQTNTLFTVNQTEKYSVPLLGKHHAKNASYAITLANILDLTVTDIQRGLSQLKHTGMRFELLTGINHVTLINDAYNASVTSMKAAIEVVKAMPGYNEKVLVLGDILELGAFAMELHIAVAEVIDESINTVFTYGDHAAFISETVTKSYPSIHVRHFTEKNELIDMLLKEALKDNLIFFKASRGMALEQIISELIN